MPIKGPVEDFISFCLKIGLVILLYAFHIPVFNAYTAEVSEIVSNARGLLEEHEVRYPEKVVERSNSLDAYKADQKIGQSKSR